MELQEIADGLWRWTAQHPEWDAEEDGDWDREVGCVLYAAADATVLIDPLVVPQDDDAAWGPLDRVVQERGLPVVVLTTIEWHSRSRDAAVRRYGARDVRGDDGLPAGVVAQPFPAAAETMYWLPAVATLVPGDRLLNPEGRGLQPSPPSWTGLMPRPLSAPELASVLRPLLDLPAERVLVSHGPPVLTGGREALARAIADHAG
ncbi:hypothetical protein [Patulibacter americanus]|uniref:hypothetical protein n=1 Tax=Patulibacter americanus TaxID=588672 RepID=UPI0003B3B99C|nr:hypothetical protein [Patulibacter americanus]